VTGCDAAGRWCASIQRRWCGPENRWLTGAPAAKRVAAAAGLDADSATPPVPWKCCQAISVCLTWAAWHRHGLHGRAPSTPPPRQMHLHASEAIVSLTGIRLHRPDHPGPSEACGGPLLVLRSSISYRSSFRYLSPPHHARSPGITELSRALS